MNASSAGTRLRPCKVRRGSIYLLFLVALIGVRITAQAGGPNPVRAQAAADPHWLAHYASLPLSFERNEGQTDGRVKYLTRGQGYTMFLTSQTAVLKLRPAEGAGKCPEAVVRMKLVGARAGAEVRGEEELAGRSNYFLGRDAGRWYRDIPTYGRVRYRQVYRGVDLVYYGRQGELENDFEVAAGGGAGQIRLWIEGGRGMKVDGQGDLVVEVGKGEVRWRRPVAYQERGGEREWVKARYERRGPKEIGIALGPYDHGRKLIIDPVLSYATYLGGTGGDVAYAIAVDSSGNAYVTGVTNSTNFPPHTPEQSSNRGNGDVFVTKLNATGTALVYSTYLGGTGSDTGTAIAVSASGDAFITGATSSTDFPTTTTAFQTLFGGGTCGTAACSDAFVTQLNSSGDQLVYSSYLGGGGSDLGLGIAVDTSGNAYIAGTAQSSDFPTVNPLQPLSGGGSDVFVAKVNFAGSALLYSTYLGGTEADVGQAIQVDNAGNAFIAGYTFSSSFPIQNALQSSNAGQVNAFVAEVNAAGSGLVFSTYLGGSGDDRAYGIALDASGIYVTGASRSADFPTTSGTFQTSNHGTADAFVTKLNPAGSAKLYSTLLGGSGIDQGNAIAVDGSGDAFITGFTQSNDFPTANPVQAILGISGGGSCGSTPCSDAFVTEVNPTGDGLIYSTYLGGRGADFGQGVALDSSGEPYVTGSTSSPNFPATAGAFQGSLSGIAGNAYVAKIVPTDAPGISIVPATLNFGNQSLSVRSAAQSVAIVNMGTQPLVITQITSSSADFAEADDCIVGAGSGTLSAGGGSCTINVTFTPSVVGSETDQITIDDNAYNPSGLSHFITVSGVGVTAATSVTVSPGSLSFGNQTVGTGSASQTVTITNTGTATLNITGISTTGDFSKTESCSAKLNILNVGETCTVDVTFNPIATGGRSGTLSISDNAAGSPQTVALSGTGLAMFSVSSSTPATTIVAGTTTATFTVSASAPSSFTGNITFSCSSGTTCAFSPASIFAGQTSTLTVSALTASIPNPYNFKINGTSGSQTATASLSILLADFTLTGSPSLNTIVSGQSAPYSILVAPLNGFNSQVNLACGTLPTGASCQFSTTSVTPNGSPATVTLNIITTKSTAVAWQRGVPPQTPPLAVIWISGLAILLNLIYLLIRLRSRPANRFSTYATKFAVLTLIVGLGLLLSACRPANTITGGTPTGNYTITITGTLNSDSSVIRNATINLAVT